MVLWTGSWFLDFILTIITLLLTLYFMVKRRFTYWERKGVPCAPARFPFGSVTDLIMQRKSFAQVFQSVYSDAKRKGHKYTGAYFMTNKTFVPIDPELVKSMLTKDFKHFSNRGIYFNERSDPLSAHLVSLPVNKWKPLRTKITPTFTAGKLKMMFQTIVDCSQGIYALLEEAKSTPIDIGDVAGRYTTDVIGVCAFGIDCNSLKNPNAEFRDYCKKVFISTPMLMLKQFIAFIYPNFFKFFNGAIIPSDVSDFFLRVVHETIIYRQHNKVDRNDFLNLLLQLKNDEDKSNRQDDSPSLTTQQIAAQCFIFFLAGFETSSSTLTFCLFELAQNSEIQKKVRSEINAVLAKHNGKFTYESIMEMQYMDNVINETLRKYPTIPLLNRMCTQDFPIPGTNIIIKEGTYVFIPIISMQNDPDNFPDPEKFDPDRFVEGRKEQWHPFAYIPFGEGPRICIGARFASMQIKVGLTVLLRNFKYSLNDRTKLPLDYEPKSFVLNPKGGIWLNVEKII